MIIGHLPAAYIISRHLLRRMAVSQNALWMLLFAGLVGGVFPDLDMFYYHLVDLRQHHHHSYWSHWPLVWSTLFVFAAFWWWRKAGTGAAAAVLFTLNGFVHLCLDTSLGRIQWLAPFDNRPFTLFELPAHYEPWWLNFVLSWTFLFELSLLAWAMLLFIRLERGWVMKMAGKLWSFTDMLLPVRRR